MTAAMKIINSQRFVDDATVDAKRVAADYVVTVTPVFEIDGNKFCAVIDGHHSFEAAKADRVDPEFIEAEVQECDRIQLLKDGRIDDYLEASYMGDGWYDIATGCTVF